MEVFILPFLAKKQPQTGVLVKTRPQDEDKTADETPDIHICAQDLINAVHSRDTKGVAEALQAAFEILDASPHIEGEHLNENTEE